MSKSIEDSVILIVDDTPENIDILNEVLSNYKRKIATNGELALKIANAEIPPDIILLDVMMPGMDGFEVCERLKKEEKTRNIPIIFITAMSEVEDETKGLRLGAVDFITKPISPPIVKARVKNHLDLLHSRLLLEEKNTELAHRNKYITDSINYAKRIQTAILPSDEALGAIFPEHFIFYKPKDIVSGDFYWANQVKDKKIIAVSDCTGHGVPGAFMSMIGNTLLNEIINVKGITDPAEILDFLDKGIIEELRKEEDNSTFDGMDIGICVINEKSKILEFAGAFRVLYVVNDGEFIELKGVKKSIGDNSKNIPFSKHIISYGNEACVFMTTDGFIDQHNPAGKKYGSKKLKEIILANGNKKCRDLKNIFSNALNQHKQDQIQRDDITIFGFRIGNKQDQVKKDPDMIIAEYNGPCTHEILKDIGQKINKKLAGITSPRTIKQVFICSNELIQNIQFYSADKTEIEGKLVGLGEVKIKLNGNEISVETWNSATTEKGRRIQERISYLNSLDSDTLKKVYKEQMKGESGEESKGAGLGFMEIIRKTNNKLEIECTRIDENKSKIHFKSVIKMEN